jgi:hypothetical protein
MLWQRLSLAIASTIVGLVASPPNPPSGERAEGTIQLVGHMRLARAAATATVISSDRILITGGMAQGGGTLREFEIFDASTNRIVGTGEMDESRAGHSATRLADGRVLVLGGYNGNYLKSAVMFDPRTSRFTAAGAMSVGRSGHTATLLRDGTVLIVGGVGDGWSFLSSAEVYDPRSARFTPVRSMRVARESHTATLLVDGRVLIAGGHRDRRENIVVYASTEIYDPSQERFGAGPTLTMARHKHEAAALADGRVLVVGGSDPRDHVHYTSAEILEPNANRWIAVSGMRNGRYKLRDTAVRLRDGRILIAGSGRFAEVFDPRTSRFGPIKGDFGEEYAFASAVRLDDGRAVVLGGYDDAMRNSDGIWLFRESP